MCDTPMEIDVRIAMSDGVELAATLYLPNGIAPQPCLLEALPYRKDDVGCGAADSYRRLRDVHRYAVCRVDVRGTGSSSGTAVDEYTEREQDDLCEVIDWLSRQTWCDGSVGMWGTSYSGFNSLQVAAKKPPALKAVCAMYATDDRWTDDVHWRGGQLKTLELVDYCHYITAMNMLPPVPDVFGDGWREEWLARLDEQRPWVLNWLSHNRNEEYWGNGSVGRGGWESISCPVMLVAGWADGYRNNTFRAAEALRRNGVPYRLIVGPWSHADPSVARPGPRIDLEHEIVAWWDTWLRGRGTREPSVEVFVRESTRPSPTLDVHEGFWVDGLAAIDSAQPRRYELVGAKAVHVEPDVGTAAWTDCAVDVPSGQSGDQRLDDAISATWQWPVERGVIITGHPRARLRISASTDTAALSVKLCDVFPDGTSALITRGSVDLAHDGPLVPGTPFDVDVALDACAYMPAPGHTLRLAVAGSDWPAVAAPPKPVTLTVHSGRLEVPITSDVVRLGEVFKPSPSGYVSDRSVANCTITRDVLQRTTTCNVGYGSSHEAPFSGTVRQVHSGSVSVHGDTFEQHVVADCVYDVQWPGVEITVDCTMQVDVTDDGYAVEITGTAAQNGCQVFERVWTATHPRRG